jgi:catechol 2,3-dioxygenase-like lactoylglutathione lyase family enzyme
MRILISLVIVLFAIESSAQSVPLRPRITGIDHVAFFTTSPEANERLYMSVFGLSSASPIEPGEIKRFIVGSQWIGYSMAPDPGATDRMDHVAFATEDCETLRRYLAAQGMSVPTAVSSSKYGFRSFVIKDPDGHRIEFIERTSAAGKTFDRHSGGSGYAVSHRMIHTGFIVRDRAAEDHFYKEVLGFRLYWHGGMKDSDTDWAAMQVPDGTDWLEYMLNVDSKPDLRLTGIMNHISLGVKDMKQTEARLRAHGWKPHDANDHPQIGRDGKWQFNIFDPDSTRIELMEFTPTRKPCCSDFQGSHPSE